MDPGKQGVLNHKSPNKFQRRITNSQINIQQNSLKQLLKNNPYSVNQHKSFSQLILYDSFTCQKLGKHSRMFSSNNIKSPKFIKKNSMDISQSQQEQQQQQQQTISSLQQLLQRTTSLLNKYKQQIDQHIKEKEEMQKYIQQLQIKK